MGELTHKQLVTRAATWLRNTLHCSVVMAERVAYTNSGEIPDAIGWTGGKCILVECKCSRSDFFADRKKVSRRDGAIALGDWRFYLTPPGLVRPHEVPEGWGLYEVHDRQVRHAGGVKYANATRFPFKSDQGSEVALLLSSIRRLEISATVFVREESPHA